MSRVRIVTHRDGDQLPVEACARASGDHEQLPHYEEMGPDDPMPPAVRFNAV